MQLNPFMKGMQLPVKPQQAQPQFGGVGGAQVTPAALKGVEGGHQGQGVSNPFAGIKAHDPSGTKFGAHTGLEAVKGVDISKPNMAADGAVAAQFGGQFGEVAKRLNVFA